MLSHEFVSKKAVKRQYSAGTGADREDSWQRPGVKYRGEKGL